MTEVTVVADDLTGAAEIAAMRHRQGRPAIVRRDLDGGPVDAPFQVFDTDSRLDPPAVAVEKINRLIDAVGAESSSFWYKKVDSVLRGCVKAECTALAHGLRRSKVLLVPANPSLGRKVENGTLLVGGQPVAETPFCHDPHHPATSSCVIDLLERSPGLEGQSAAPGEPLPPHVLTAGDAASAADLDRWAESVEAEVLGAGGAEFFEALLRRWSPGRGAEATKALPSTLPPTLVVLGSIDPASQEWRELIGGHNNAALLPLTAAMLDPTAKRDPGRDWLEAAVAALEAGKHVVTWVPLLERIIPDLPLRAREALALVTTALVRRAAVAHLVVAGGSTAATLLDALHWQRLSIAHEWAPGVVTLRPAEAPEFTITLKPGSYAWSEKLNQTLFPA